MIHNINNMLYIILIILIIYNICLYLYYDPKNNTTISKYNAFSKHVDNNIDNNIDNKLLILDLLNIATNNAQQIINHTIKEKFTSFLTVNDINKQNLALDAIMHTLDTEYTNDIDPNNPDNPNSIINKLKNKLSDAGEVTNTNKETLLKMLTNIYIINYINFTNTQNAEAYKTFLKYNK